MADFNELNLFDFFGENEMEDAPKKVEETKAVSSEKENINVSDDLDDTDDDAVTEDEGDDKPAAPKTTSKKKAEEKIKTPVDVYGRNWSYSITEVGELTGAALVKKVYEAGYVEVVFSDPIIVPGMGVYFTSKTSETSSNQLVEFPSGKNYIVADGMVQMPVTTANFADFNPDEISVQILTEKFAEQFNNYADCGLYTDNTYGVAVPVMSRLGDADTVELPVKVIKNGTEYSLDADSFGGKTAKEIIDYLCADETKAGLSCKLTKANNSLYFVEYEVATGKNVKAKKLYGVNKDDLKVNKDAKTKEAMSYYTLPLEVYFVTINQKIPLTAENFGGKTKVSEDVVLDYLKQTFSILRSKDRKIDVVYAKEQGILSVALVSGTKGADAVASALPSRIGFFSIVRTIDELREALERKYFLGIYQTRKKTYRVESSPVGVFSGACVGGNLNFLSEVGFASKVGRIPITYWNQIMADFKAHPQLERILRIYYDSDNKEFKLVKPTSFSASKSRIFYTFSDVPMNWHLYLTVHSHNTMPAYFSITDNEDEAITGLYGVIGTINKEPTYKFRACMENSSVEIPRDMLFE